MVTIVDSMMVNGDRQHERVYKRIGAVCAIFGVVVTMAAGANFQNLTNEGTTEAILQALASRPHWYWPAVHAAFILGAFLWVCAFAAFARSRPSGAARAFGWLATTGVILGAAIHIVDSSISGVGLTRLAQSWINSSPSERLRLLQDGDLLLSVMHGTWPNVLNFYSGLPFVFSGVAATLSPDYPRWFGWIGILAGLGSLFAGVTMFLGFTIVPGRVSVAFAIVVSLWLLVVGVRMWRSGDAAQ